MTRCANPKCRREVVKHPVVVTVGELVWSDVLGQWLTRTLTYGLTCARKLGLVPSRRRHRMPVATPRPLDLTPVDSLPGQLALFDLDPEGGNDE